MVRQTQTESIYEPRRRGGGDRGTALAALFRDFNILPADNGGGGGRKHRGRDGGHRTHHGGGVVEGGRPRDALHRHLEYQ